MIAVWNEVLIGDIESMALLFRTELLLGILPSFQRELAAQGDKKIDLSVLAGQV